MDKQAYVVKGECPQQFVSGGSFADDGQELHEVAESYATSTIPEIIQTLNFSVFPKYQ